MNTQKETTKKASAPETRESHQERMRDINRRRRPWLYADSTPSAHVADAPREPSEDNMHYGTYGKARTELVKDDPDILNRLIERAQRAEARNAELLAALRECLDVFELPEPTPDAFGTCYTATQRSGTIAKAKLKAEAAIARVERGSSNAEGRAQ